MTYDPFLDGPGRDPDRGHGCVGLVLLGCGALTAWFLIGVVLWRLP